MTVLFLFFLLSVGGFCFAKEPEGKVFLALFKPTELKQNKISIKTIESQFSSFFDTRSYSGNSELALLIEIPTDDFNACFLGEFLINMGDGRQVQLQQIAFRVFDLSENKSLHQRYLTMYEDNLAQKKKTTKAVKAASLP